MALREFVDRNGVKWKVWDVTPAQVHPRSKDERLFIGYELGWLTFEAEGGELRRRLCPCPRRWDESPPEELERLCAEAEPVAPRRKSADAPGAEPGRATASDEEIARVSVAVRESEEEPPSARRRHLRTFQYPGGRIWTVGTLTATEKGATREVLRFVSGAHKIDLETWPDDWERYSDAQLAELLRRGAPPRTTAPNPTPHRRRRDDLHA